MRKSFILAALLLSVSLPVNAQSLVTPTGVNGSTASTYATHPPDERAMTPFLRA